jgi:hypothetical protein
VEEEFRDVKRGLIVLPFQTSQRDVDDACACFHTPKLLGALRADLTHIRGSISSVDFR